ncbi:hypothetical protein FAF44_02935 [Nonomuraea sp. MG754425]|uniref:hypothetical protein n=1 Tax=Nonomuraea sp. MG754425 TaxID=2570319 RepID=UPI001F3E3002|nr:hypothetical protein [Nonomuraea sp. MG754425]MCF6467370.1 hypothetical protein [Nonomuraea sp. MG754425]
MTRTLHRLRTPEDVRAHAAEGGFKVIKTGAKPYVKLPSASHPNATVSKTIVDNGADAETRFEVYETALHWLTDQPK